MRVRKYDTRQNNETLRPYLVKELSINYPEIKTLDTYKKIGKIFCDIFEANILTEERVWFVGLNTKNHLLGVMEISRGSIDESMVPVREILAKALMLNAPKIVLVHNHPSGDSTPSSKDKNATTHLLEAAKMVGINLLDHVIIGHGNVFSFFENGYL